MRALLSSRFSLCLATGLILCACALPGLQRASTLQGNYPSGIKRYHVEVDSAGRKHGLEQWWYESGTSFVESRWVGGRRNGVYRAWYPNGNLWYEGRDSLGVARDTLRYWHSNGQLKSLSVFDAGRPVFLETWDSEGLTSAQRAQRDAQAAARVAAQRRADSLGVLESIRSTVLSSWALRVRATVEPHWKLSESLKKTPRRAVARLRVASTGTLLDVTWLEKSGSKEFDQRAAQALSKVKRFPPLPPELGTDPLDLRYEFATPGLAPPRRKLRLRNPEGALDAVAPKG